MCVTICRYRTFRESQGRKMGNVAKRAKLSSKDFFIAILCSYNGRVLFAVPNAADPSFMVICGLESVTLETWRI